MTISKLIAIAGPAGVGKTTVIEMLKEFCPTPITVMSFMEPIESLAKALGWKGRKDDKGVRLLQLLATECGRECINENIWLEHWAANFRELRKNDPLRWVVVDDLKYQNEADLIKMLRGSCGIVLRPEYDWGEHPSEAGKFKCQWDFTIANSGTEEELYKMVKEYSESIFFG